MQTLKVNSVFGHRSLDQLSHSHGEGNGTPLQYSCLENPMVGGAWWAAVHGVTKSRTWLSDFTFTFHFHALEKEMATHSSVLAWRIPGMVEPDGLPSMGSHRVGHDWSDLAAWAIDLNMSFPSLLTCFCQNYHLWTSRMSCSFSQHSTKHSVWPRSSFKSKWDKYGKGLMIIEFIGLICLITLN